MSTLEKIPVESLLCTEPVPDDSKYVLNTGAFRFHGKIQANDCFVRKCEFDISRPRKAKYHNLPNVCAENQCKKVEIVKFSRPDVI